MRLVYNKWFSFEILLLCGKQESSFAMRLFLLIVVLLAIGHEAVAIIETTSYTPTALVSGVTALVVEIEVEVGCFVFLSVIGLA